MTTVRIYIQNGLVQHVDPDRNADIQVRIIDCDTEGSPASDTRRLTPSDKLALPEGMEDQRQAFITVWRNGEAVSRG